MSAPDIRCERSGAIALVTLDRPQALNALDLPMLRLLHEALTAWRDDPDVRTLVVRGNGRAFCAGGDVKAVVANRGDTAFMDEVYRVEYQADHLIHRFGRPVVPLMHGITMGGGCGIALHASHPVVAEDITLAMPETGIGLFPDVAGSHFLSRCPGNFGLYMGLTGASIGAADAVALGLARAVVPRDRHADLIDRLASGTAADAAIAELATARPDTARARNRREIARHFQAPDALSLVQALESLGTAWAEQTAALLRTRCPFSMEVSIRAYHKARGQSVAQVLATDFRIVQRLMLRDDYFEGVRARLIDRGRAPRWSPGVLEEVALEAVDQCFAPLEGPELWNWGDVRPGQSTVLRCAAVQLIEERNREDAK